jgi:RNA polymerase sigma factor (sigma-70 family)
VDVTPRQPPNQDGPQDPGQSHSSDAPGDLAALLLAHRETIASVIRAEAGTVLLRFESVDDLAQGVGQEAVRGLDAFRWQGEAAFVAWLRQIARRHLANRRDYWFACKRNPGAILRLTFTGAGGQPVDRRELADTSTGPATFAFRREQLVIVTKAMAMLLPRDRDLVTWTTDGASASEIASRLGVSLDAAEKARSRAVERLRKAFALLSRPAVREPPPARDDDAPPGDTAELHP